MSMRRVAVRPLSIVLILAGTVWGPPVHAAQTARLAQADRRVEAPLAARTPASCPLRWPYIVLTCVA